MALAGLFPYMGPYSSGNIALYHSHNVEPTSIHDIESTLKRYVNVVCLLGRCINNETTLFQVVCLLGAYDTTYVHRPKLCTPNKEDAN